MPFIGNTPDVNFTSFAKQDLTGVTGSPAKRGYTLTHAVANANEIEVFVNNVRQEPTESYTVNGTGLTMTGDVETSDDFYIIYLGKAIQTTVPPDGSVSTAKIASSAVDLTSKVTGVLPVANGGTGASSYNASALVKLVTLNLSNSADATIDSTYINSTYDTYKFIYDFLPVANSAYLYTRAIVGGSEDTGNNYGYEVFPLDGGAISQSDSTNVMAVHQKYTIGNGDGEGITGEFTLFNVNSTTRSACISGHSTSFTSNPVPTQNVFGGAYKSDQRVKVRNGLRLFMETSSATTNIASGFVTVYGVVK